MSRRLLRAALASGYGPVALALLVVTGLLLALQSVVPVFSLALVYLGLVAVAAARYGLGPSLLATAFGIVALELVFVPFGPQALQPVESLIRLILFVVAALATSTLTASQRQAAIEERRRADELNAIIEHMAEGVAIVDHEGRILRINGAGLAILGWTEREIPRSLVAYRAYDLRYPDDRPIPLEDWPPSRALRGETFTDFEVRLTRPDGEVRSVVFAGSPVRDGSGALVLAVLVFHDVTAQRELERSREDFVRAVSHDLRAPLSIVLGNAELQERLIPAGKTEPALRAADAIAASARRMNTMIQDLVESARLEAGGIHLNLQPVRLQEALSELIERASVLAKPGRLRVDVEPDLPPVRADPARLDRVVMNLVSNALKYSAPDAPVELRARRDGRYAVVSVTDHGPGIPPEALPHLFERYYQVAGGPAREGLGLGLYISRMLVEMHGGRIWAESRAGEGSTFSFTLPLALDEAPAGGEPAAAGRRGQASNGSG